MPFADRRPVERSVTTGQNRRPRAVTHHRKDDYSICARVALKSNQSVREARASKLKLPHMTSCLAGMAGWTRMVAEFGRILQHPPQCLDRAGAARTTPTPFLEVEIMSHSHRLVDHIVGYLASIGVDCIFGVDGANIEDLYDAAFLHSDMDAVLAKHEFSAVAMADGYSRSGSGFGVVATSAWGALNLVAGLGNCLPAACRYWRWWASRRPRWMVAAAFRTPAAATVHRMPRRCSPRCRCCADESRPRRTSRWRCPPPWRPREPVAPRCCCCPKIFSKLT